MAPAPAQPGWPAPGEAAFAATSPPPTADDFEAARGQAPAYGQQAGGQPAAQQPPVAPPQPSVPQTRPSTKPGSGADPETLDPNAPRALAGFLVSYEGNDLGVFHPIHQGQNLVGRKGAAPGLHIELEHGTTSSRHAMLLATARPGRLKVEDLGSTNGTFVGDLMLERGKRHELKDGDIVRFGGYVTIIKIV
jgi:pSer/pThr/pTyr-binding forkhead associated (FHA) protein